MPRKNSYGSTDSENSENSYQENSTSRISSGEEESTFTPFVDEFKSGKELVLDELHKFVKSYDKEKGKLKPKGIEHAKKMIEDIKKEGTILNPIGNINELLVYLNTEEISLRLSRKNTNKVSEKLKEFLPSHMQKDLNSRSSNIMLTKKLQAIIETVNKMDPSRKNTKSKYVRPG